MIEQRRAGSSYHCQATEKPDLGECQGLANLHLDYTFTGLLLVAYELVWASSKLLFLILWTHRSFTSKQIRLNHKSIKKLIYF